MTALAGPSTCRRELHAVGLEAGGYEEYHPYGSTAWWSNDGDTEVSRKRYRYTGMERDEETGLQCHGVRYYAPWLGRWMSADPIGLGDGVNRFAYCHGGPVGGRDATGLGAGLPVPGAIGTSPTTIRLEPLLQAAIREVVAAREDKDPDREMRANVFFDVQDNTLLIPTAPEDIVKGVPSAEIKDPSHAGEVKVDSAVIEARRVALAESTGHRVLAAGEIHTHPRDAVRAPSVADILGVARGEVGQNAASFGIAIVVEPGARGGPDNAYVMLRAPKAPGSDIIRGVEQELLEKLAAGKGGKPHTAAEAAWYLQHLSRGADSALYAGDPRGELQKVEAVAPSWYAGWERRHQAAQDRKDALINEDREREVQDAPTGR